MSRICERLREGRIYQRNLFYETQPVIVWILRPCGIWFFSKNCNIEETIKKRKKHWLYVQGHLNLILVPSIHCLLFDTFDTVKSFNSSIYLKYRRVCFLRTYGEPSLLVCGHSTMLQDCGWLPEMGRKFRFFSKHFNLLWPPKLWFLRSKITLYSD